MRFTSIRSRTKDHASKVEHNHTHVATQKDRGTFDRPPDFNSWLGNIVSHWRRLFENIGWDNQNIGGEKGSKKW